MTDRERVRIAVGRVLVNCSNYPREAQARLLGRDLAPLIAMVTDSVMTELEKSE